MTPTPKKEHEIKAETSSSVRNPVDDHKIAAECREKLLRTARRSVEKQKVLKEVNPSLQTHLNLLVAIDQYDLVRLRYDQECLTATVKEYRELIDEIISNSFMFVKKRDEDKVAALRQEDAHKMISNIEDAYKTMTTKNKTLKKLMKRYEETMERIRLSLMCYTAAPVIRNEYIKLYYLTEKEYDVATYKWQQCLKYSKKALDAKY